MSRFYVTLPSNSSMDYYPENIVACYTTKLANVVELEGDWEVGLAEVSIPSAVYSVIADKCYYVVSMDNKHFPSIVVPQGHYKRVSDLIKVMHSSMPVDGAGNPFVMFTSKSGYIEMTFTEIYRPILSIRFSENLSNILGADADVSYNHTNARTRRKFSLMEGDVNSVYVYCDILKHVTVGDTKAPLLRIVHKPKKQEGNVHQTFSPILYVPLQKNFDTVEINMMTDTGQPVSFRFGKSFVVLEFRRNVHSYLGL